MNYRSLYKLYKHKKTYELFEKTKKIPVLVGSWDKTKAITLPKKNVGIFFLFSGATNTSDYITCSRK